MKKVETKKRTPDFSGTPGALVSDIEGLGLVFGTKRISPYDGLLDQLSSATDVAIAAGKSLPALKFESVKAKASIYGRAAKKGFKLTFAVTPVGELYVRIDGRTDAIERRRGLIRKALAISPLNSIQLASKLREGGDSNADATGVAAMMSQMQKSGEAVLQDGGTWKLIRSKLAVA